MRALAEPLAVETRLPWALLYSKSDCTTLTPLPCHPTAHGANPALPLKSLPKDALPLVQECFPLIPHIFQRRKTTHQNSWGSLGPCKNLAFTHNSLQFSGFWSSSFIVATGWCVTHKIWEELIGFQLSSLCEMQQAHRSHENFLKMSSVLDPRSLILLTGCAYLEFNKLSEVLFVCTWFIEVNLEMLILNCLVMKYHFDKVISFRKWLHYSLCCLPAAFQRVSSLHSFWPFWWPPVPVTISQLYVGL